MASKYFHIPVAILQLMVHIIITEYRSLCICIYRNVLYFIGRQPTCMKLGIRELYQPI